MWSVPLSIWKLHPSLFFYVLLVVIQRARSKSEGRFLKGMLGATSIAIGVVESGMRDRVGPSILCAIRAILS